MKKLKYLALILALMSSLVMNVATVAFSSFALAVSAVFEAVTGTSAVASDLRRRNTLKDQQIKDLKVDRDVKERRSTKLAGELAQEKQRISSLTDDLAVRDRRIAQLSSTIKNPQVTYRSQRRPLNQAVEDTVGRITQRTAFGAKRNVAAVFGEGLPLVGVGVAVAVTGYELKDSCDNLKDLRELELSINPSLASPDGVTEVCGMQVPSRTEVWSTVSTSPSTASAKTKEYMPDLGEMQIPDISEGLGIAQDGGKFLWAATKDTSATMKLGLDHNIRMLQDLFRQHIDSE